MVWSASFDRNGSALGQNAFETAGLDKRPFPLRVIPIEVLSSDSGEPDFSIHLKFWQLYLKVAADGVPDGSPVGPFDARTVSLMADGHISVLSQEPNGHLQNDDQVERVDWASIRWRNATQIVEVDGLRPAIDQKVNQETIRQWAVAPGGGWGIVRTVNATLVMDVNRGILAAYPTLRLESARFLQFMVVFADSVDRAALVFETQDGASAIVFINIVAGAVVETARMTGLGVEAVDHTCLSSDGKWAVVQDSPSAIALVSTDHGTREERIEGRMAMSNKRTRGVVVYHNDVVRLLAPGPRLDVLGESMFPGIPLEQCVLSPDGKYAARMLWEKRTIEVFGNDGDIWTFVESERDLRDFGVSLRFVQGEVDQVYLLQGAAQGKIGGRLALFALPKLDWRGQ